MFGEFRTMGEGGGEMARQVDRHRLEGRLREARRDRARRALSVLARIPGQDRLAAGRGMEPRGA